MGKQVKDSLHSFNLHANLSAGFLIPSKRMVHYTEDRILYTAVHGYISLIEGHYSRLYSLP